MARRRYSILDGTPGFKNQAITIVGAFLVFLPAGLSGYWGNLSAYINSYMRNNLGQHQKVQAPWIFSIFLVCDILGIMSHKVICQFINRRLATTLAILLFNSGIFLSSMTIGHSVLTTCITIGALSGLGSGLLYGTTISYVIDWGGSRVGFLTQTVSTGYNIGAIIINQAVTLYVNPRNYDTDTTVGPVSYFSQLSILDNVPKVLRLLGTINISCQLLGFVLIRDYVNGCGETEVREKSDFALQSQTEEERKDLLKGCDSDSWCEDGECGNGLLEDTCFIDKGAESQEEADTIDVKDDGNDMIRVKCQRNPKSKHVSFEFVPVSSENGGTSWTESPWSSNTEVDKSASVGIGIQCERRVEKESRDMTSSEFNVVKDDHSFCTGTDRLHVDSWFDEAPASDKGRISSPIHNGLTVEVDPAMPRDEDNDIINATHSPHQNKSTGFKEVNNNSEDELHSDDRVTSLRFKMCLCCGSDSGRDSKARRHDKHFRNGSSFVREITPRQLFFTKSAYALLFLILARHVSFLLLSNYYKMLGETYIHNDHFLASMGSMLSVVSIVTKPLTGLVIDRFGIRIPSLISLFALSVSSFVFPFTPKMSKWVFLSVGVFYEGCICAVSACCIMGCLLILGKKYFTANYGLLLSVTIVLDVLAPVIVQSTLVHFGWFVLFHGACLAVIFILLITAFIMPRL